MTTQRLRCPPLSSATSLLVFSGLAIHAVATTYEVFSWWHFQSFGRWANWTLEVLLQWHPEIGWYPADLLVVRLFTLPVGRLVHYTGLVVLGVALALWVVRHLRVGVPRRAWEKA